MQAQKTTTQSPSRERIVETAMALFVDQGFGAVSMQQIAAKVGITKATLYHHFEDKQDLFLATARMAFDQTYQQMGKLLATDASFEHKLTDLVSFMLSSERISSQRLTADLRQHVSVDQQKALWKQFEKPWQLIEPAVADAAAAGEIVASNPAFLARYVYGSLIGLTQVRRLETDGPISDAEYHDLVVETILAGINPRTTHR